MPASPGPAAAAKQESKTAQPPADQPAAAPAGKANGKDTLAVAEPLAGENPIRAVGGGGRVAFDANGRIPVRVGEYVGPAVADTGAQISVIPAVAGG